jgi:hypothetical protein
VINLKKKDDRKKEITIGILGLLIYLVLPSFETLPFDLLNINLSNVPSSIKIFYSFIFEVLMMALILIIYRKTLKKDFEDLKKNHKEYFKFGIKYYLIGLGIMMFSNLLINLFSSNGIAENEQTVRSLLQNNPLYIYFSAVIMAPICEELVFRKGIRNLIKNDTAFILVSGIFFGFLHITSFESLVDILYIIPYSSLGIAFAYVLAKEKNIFSTIMLHLMHNGILVSLQILIYFVL